MFVKWLLWVSVLLACCAITVTSTINTDGYGISCSSDFTPQVGSFCVGIPLQCTVQLNNISCSNSPGVPVPLSTRSISLQVTGTGAGSLAPDFSLSQQGFLLTVTIKYYPVLTSRALKVEISSLNTECKFNVTSNNLPVFSSECLEPLQLDLTNSDPSYPGEVEGGDIVLLDLNITSNSHLIQSLAVAAGNFHPGLLLFSNVSFTATDVTVQSQPYDNDIHNISAGNFVPLLFVNELSPSENLSVSLRFQVQPFVQPEAALYFSFHAFYYISSFGGSTFKTSTPQFRELVVSSPFARRRQFRLSLSSYSDGDRTNRAFPPNEDDIFEIRVPLIFPCVMTSLNIELTIPEFQSDDYTFFYTNVTSVSVATPPNFFALPSFCDYRNIASFDPIACYTDSLSNSSAPWPVITYGENSAAGIGTVFLDFGVVWRSVTVGEDCAGNNPNPSCSCDRGSVDITLLGVVLTELPCNNQTLADNVTMNFTFISDVNTWINSDTELSNEIPQIMWNDYISTTTYPINASSPAISLDVSSHSGDAGDAFNITFGVKHNDGYSSFTAYDLNYTFSIDPHLDPEDNITICFFNTSSVPISCESVPFINNEIMRYGYHDE